MLPLALVLLLASCARETNAPQAAELPVERSVLVRTVEVAPRTVVDTMSLPADLLPLRRAVLAAEVAGTVEALRVEEGQAVAAGQVLAAIDTRSLAQQLAEAEAHHHQRQVWLERAEALYARRGITEQQRVDAQAERDMAAARLQSARLELEKSQLEAPWAGRVARRLVEVGDYVTPGQAMIELLDARRLKVRAPAPSSDVPHLRTGIPAEVRLDAYPGEVFRGEVVRLGAELDAAARTLDVEVEIDNPDGKLKPGMVARLEIPRQTLEGALLVPLAALVELERGRVVYVVEAGRAVQRPVTLGPTLGDEVVIGSGLAAGERVIVEGQQQVSPEQAVREAGAQPSDEAGAQPAQEAAK